MNNREPYTYLIGWSSLNKWYYGRRTAIGCSPAELWKKYFTSSKEVKKFRKSFGEPDIIEVRKTFSNVSDCKAWEMKVLKRLNVANNPNFLNLRNSDAGACTNDTMTVRDVVSGYVFQTSIYDERIVTGQLVSVNARKTQAINRITGEHVGLISIDDPLWLNGTYVSNSLGKAGAVDAKTGRSLGLVSTIDCRWLTGEILVASTGEHHRENAPAKCPNTGKTLGRIALSDTRWKTGEIVAQSKGRYTGCAAAKERSTNIPLGMVSKDDPRWKTGEIVGIRFGLAVAKDTQTGEVLGKVSKDDPRWKTGEIVGITKKKVA